MRDEIEKHLQRSLQTMQQAAADADLQKTIGAVAECIVTALRGGNKIMLAGNGGSAADAQHIAAEFLVRFRANRDALPAVALTTDTSVLTAIGNDLGFDQVFERQIRGLARQGDVFIGLSTSGTSPNVLRALRAARDMGVKTVGFTGIAGTGMKSLCDLLLVVPSDDTALIQQIHITAAHAICIAVEGALFADLRR
jgi:D-sedoheptulose 7-phosphate isomerase